MKPLAPLELKLTSHESSLERLVQLYFAYVNARRQGKTLESSGPLRPMLTCRRADFAFAPLTQGDLAQREPASQPSAPLKAAWR